MNATLNVECPLISVNLHCTTYTAVWFTTCTKQQWVLPGSGLPRYKYNKNTSPEVILINLKQPVTISADFGHLKCNLIH